jgi:multisubunit Na+/H+ antiporter MnhE subunit
LAKNKSKFSKKTRNTISGLMVGVASIFAVSTYMDIPQEDLRSFLVSTLLFFLVILVLAILSITVLKLLFKIKQKINPGTDDSDQPKDNE